MKNFTLVFFLLLSAFVFGQNQKYWHEISANNLPKSNAIQYTAEVEGAKFFSLDRQAIEVTLGNAPDRFVSSISSVIISIPSSNGEMNSFEVFSTQTMAAGLAQNYPQIKSYVGRNINNKAHRLRITITPFGFYAMTTGSTFGETFINPYDKNSSSYMVFNKSQASYNTHENFICKTLDFETSAAEYSESEYFKNFIEDGILRKYELAVATTVEYSNYHLIQAGFSSGDTSAAGRTAVQAAIVVSIDRVNEVFERDFGVTMELVTGNDQLISMGDANADPYVNDVSSTLLDQNQTHIDNVIGFANYDVGHVLCTDGGGLAQTPAVCTSGKARGTTGLSTPVGEYFNISILAHEFGHQFGANHTQSSNVNENFATAMEPGSGSTIMSYAGVAPPNIQNQSDAMFHYISISEVSNTFITTTGSCAENIPIANNEPIIQAIPNYKIPKSTPFKLEAIASDSNGDALTYSWDQIDNDVVPNVPMPPAPSSETGPLFRTYLPSSSPERFFPGMATLLTNSYSNLWEVLPNVSRDLNFGVIVRDNNPLGGQVANETTTVSVDANAGPFRVISQAGSGTTVNWNTNDTETITWDVANTNSFTGVNAQNVDILLSEDNGQNFDVVLAENTPNDGSHTITVPNILTSSARLMVKASDNIFFDINEANISIQANGITCVAPTNLDVTSITNNSALLSWDASSSNPADGYDYVLITDNTIPDSSTTPTGSVGAGVTSENVTSLNSNAFYEVYVRAKCGPEDLSVWSSVTEFRTTCSVLTAPVSENFEGTDFQIGSTSSNYGSCWNRTPVDSATDYTWIVGSGSTPTANTGPSDDNTGSGKYMFTESDNGQLNDVAVLNAPPIDISNLTNPILSVNYHMFGSETGNFKIQIKTIGSSIFSTEFMLAGQQQNASSDSYLLAFVDLTPYAGETINVRFIGERGAGATSDIALDDFVIEENSCLAPTNINLSSITSLNATLTWDAQPNANDGFEWVVMSNGILPNVTNAISTSSADASSTQTQITGLSAQTTYEVYIRSQCGGGLFSAWSSGINFTTPCTTIIAPYNENFDGSNWTPGSPGVIDNCWSRSTLTPGSDYIWMVRSDPTTSPNTGPQTDVSGSGNYLYTEASAFDPPFMNESDQTILEAPPIDLSGLSVPRLKFSYHMYGSTMGSLKIEVKSISSSTYTELFSISGQQQTASSDAYIEQNVGLSSFSGQIINVRILGERGSNFNSDIAIDNFIIEETTDCTTPTGLQANNTTLNTVDLSWDNVPNDLNGYEWVVMTAGVAPEPSTSAATGSVIQGITTVQVSGLDPDTNYDAYVRANCGATGISNWSLVSSFFTGYCDVSAEDLGFSNISRVKFNTIDNSSLNNGYTDYTDTYTLVNRGSTYLIEVSESGNTVYTGDQVLVWIDFNKDGDFNDSGEQVITTNSFSGDFNIYPFGGNITIPNNAALGETRMRVRIHNTNSETPNATPCGNSTIGEVEDYTIVLYDDFVYYDGSWTPNNPVNGVIPSSNVDNIAVLNGTSNISGQLIGNDLKVDTGAILEIAAPSSSLAADASVLSLAGNISNDGSLVFKSNANGSTQLDTFTGTVTGTGSVTVERFIPGSNRAFRLLSTPITSSGTILDNWQQGGLNPGDNGYEANLGTHITGNAAGNNGFDATPLGNASLFGYNNGNYTDILNTDNTSLIAGEAYTIFIRGDRTAANLSATPPSAQETTLRTTGLGTDFRTGQVTLNTGSTPQLSNTTGEFNLIANPYQSIVDLCAVDRTNLSNTVWVRNVASGTNGAWVSLDVSNTGLCNIAPPPTPTSGSSQFIQPGSAFFIETTAGSPSITFEEADKATDASQTLNIVFNETTMFYVNSRLYLSSELQNGDVERDAFGLRFDDQFTTSGGEEDADKFTNPDENIGIVNNGLKYIDKQAMPSIGHSIQLETTGYTGSTYSLVFTMANLPENMAVFIDDAYLGTQIELSDGFVFDFMVDASIPDSTASDRFSLVFDHTTLNVEDNFFGNNFSLYPNPNQGQFSIKTPNLSGDVNVEITNLLGQRVYKEQLLIENQSIDVFAKNLIEGVYIIKLTQNDKTYSTKVVFE
jgi:hypothetical protein